MKAVRFHTIIAEDQVIQIPPALSVPLGAAEIIVLQPEEQVSEKGSEGNEPHQQAAATPWPLVQHLARIATDLGIDDLPPDLSENHDHYAHGAPKGVDQL